MIPLWFYGQEEIPFSNGQRVPVAMSGHRLGVGLEEKPRQTKPCPPMPESDVAAVCT